MADDIDRAWRYHAAADDLLHSRIEALLIAQAFLIIGYAQVLTAQEFCRRYDLTLALLAIVAVAVTVTILMMVVNNGLSRGIRFLKKTHLEHAEIGDPIYIRYLEAVRGDSEGKRKPFPRIWSSWIPRVFLAFWFAASLHAAGMAFGHLSCVTK